MKKLFKLPISMLYLVVLVSCTTDSPSEPQGVPPGKPQPPEDFNDNTGGNNNGYANPSSGFLDGDSSSNTYIDMPIESSPTNLFIGRWKKTKFGIDENNDGNIKYYNYQDFEHKDCPISFLQFNNDGVVFENNSYYKNNACTINSEIDNWELIEANRFKIYVYDFIFLVKVTQSELILKYDWSYSAWGPMQTYYYERIQPTN